MTPTVKTCHYCLKRFGSSAESNFCSRPCAASYRAKRDGMPQKPKQMQFDRVTAPNIDLCQRVIANPRHNGLWLDSLALIRNQPSKTKPQAKAVTPPGKCKICSKPFADDAFYKRVRNDVMVGYECRCKECTIKVNVERRRQRNK